jgi:hypothetical protein
LTAAHLALGFGAMVSWLQKIVSLLCNHTAAHVLCTTPLPSHSFPSFLRVPLSPRKGCLINDFAQVSRSIPTASGPLSCSPSSHYSKAQPAQMHTHARRLPAWSVRTRVGKRYLSVRGSRTLQNRPRAREDIEATGMLSAARKPHAISSQQTCQRTGQLGLDQIRLQTANPEHI